MKRICIVLTFCFVMLMGCLYATDETFVIKNAPDYQLYYNNGNVAIVSNLKKDECLKKDLIQDNQLIERYQVFLPLYVQIKDDGTITRANLVKNGENLSTEKELTIRRENGSLEVFIEQVVGMPDGVGMTAETIHQGLRVYDYEIDWTVRGFVQKVSNLKVVVIRAYEEDIYNSIYENMINKNYTNIYQTVMGMNNTELSVLETYLNARYGVEWDIDAKLVQEMRELNIAKITFTDLAENHWAYNVIKSMAIKGVLNGYEDNTFRPENTLTRAEAAQIISKFFNLSEMRKDMIADVNENHWAYVAIKKVIPYIPMSGSEFKPDESITRKDFIVAIMNLRESNSLINTNTFADMNGLSEDEIVKINRANVLGIVNGYEDGTFRPNGFLTRAEACAILSRAK